MTAATIKDFVPLDPGFGQGQDPLMQCTRIFVYFLQNLFRTFPEGFGLRWSPDEESTEMLITAEKPRLSAVEKLPHIVCVLGSGQWSNLGHDQLQKLVMSTGQRTHTDLLPMTMAYHCLAREGLQARRMAWYASFKTNVFRRLLMGTGKFHHVAPGNTISAESSPTAYVGPQGEEEVVSVTVTVPFYWQPVWTIKDPAEILRKFDMTLRARDTTLRPPRIKGRPVRLNTQADLDRAPHVVQKTLISGSED
jgi:hypothetical protein